MESACTKQTEIAIIVLGPEYGSADSRLLLALEQRLLEELERSPAGLLIDMDQTIHIGCELLNVLLRCHRRARRDNCRVAFCTRDPSLQTVLRITRLDSTWLVLRTRQEAIEALKQPLSNEHSNSDSASQAGEYRH